MLAKIQVRRGTSAEWAAAAPVILSAGEPGYDTTEEKMKVGDGSTEWADLGFLGAGGVNPNILHNWDFRNPVNQRGATGTISAPGYFLDRWLLVSGGVTVNAGDLEMASGAVIEQRIEGLWLAGETVTVSVQTDAETISGTGVFPTAAGTVDITLTGFGTATLGYNAGYMFVRFAASGGQNVEVVKLELGTVSTLHLDPPVDYAVELAKCSRFLLALEPGFVNRATFVGTGYAVVVIPTKTRMRINPTHITGEIVYGQQTTGGAVAGGSWSFEARNQGVEARYVVANAPDGFVSASSLVLLSSEL